MSIKEQIAIYIAEHDYVSFAELARRFPGFEDGDNVIEVPGTENIIIWGGMTDEGANAILELFHEDKIHFWPTSLLVYLIDGMTLKFPLAKGNRIKYKDLRWFPVTLCPGMGKDHHEHGKEFAKRSARREADARR